MEIDTKNINLNWYQPTPFPQGERYVYYRKIRFKVRRLKNSKKTSWCQSIGELGTFWWKFVLIKSLTNPKKTERGTLWHFSTSILTKLKKIEGWPFGDKFFFEKMSHNATKTQRRDPLVSPGIVCYAKKENTFLILFAKPNGSIWHNKNL